MRSATLALLASLLAAAAPPPFLEVRALKYNIPMPGTGYLSEEDLAHSQWFYSLDYWREFLDAAARYRYNALTFWSAHPYDRMVRIAKYPEATGLPAAELDRNIAFFRRLFEMAAERGIETYLVTWNIHVSRSFAAKHNIPAAGADSPLVRDYQREAIKALFATYPKLTGLGTTPGERMGGMSARERLAWIADTYLAALRQVGRPAPFILRYWQSDPEATAEMLDKARYPAPVYLDIKYNGEHMYSSVRPHLQDQRWLAMARGRYRLLWHLRNDDLFILRWGDPDFVRDTVKNMAGPDTAGFVEGSELDIPGVDRIHTSAAAAHLNWQYKFQKHWFRFMLWGRLGADPGEPESAWREEFTRRFGRAGPDVYEAIHQASKILPLVTSYHWNYMNGDWFPEGSIGSWNTSYEQPRVNYRRAMMYHDIFTYIFNNTIDPSLMNIPEFVAGKKTGTTPLEVADRLEGYGRRALERIGRARSGVERGQKEFACTELDVEAAGNLGVYHAAKLRGAVELARLLLLGETKARAEALRHLQRALDAWRNVVKATEPHYVTHEVWLFGQFDWKRYTPDVERDIEIARQATPFRREGRINTYALEGMREWLEYANGLLGGAAAPAAKASKPMVIEAESAASVTPAMQAGADYISLAPAAEQRAGESITGVRDYVAAANSATYRFQLAEDGAYELWALAWWPERGAGFTVLMDEYNGRVPALRPGAKDPLASWTPTRLDRVFHLGAGPHTLRLYGRQPGARIDRLVLAAAGASRDEVPRLLKPGTDGTVPNHGN